MDVTKKGILEICVDKRFQELEVSSFIEMLQYLFLLLLQQLIMVTTLKSD